MQDRKRIRLPQMQNNGYVSSLRAHILPLGRCQGDGLTLASIPQQGSTRRRFVYDTHI